MLFRSCKYQVRLQAGTKLVQCGSHTTPNLHFSVIFFCKSNIRLTGKPVPRSGLARSLRKRAQRVANSVTKGAVRLKRLLVFFLLLFLQRFISETKFHHFFISSFSSAVPCRRQTPATLHSYIILSNSFPITGFCTFFNSSFFFAVPCEAGSRHFFIPQVVYSKFRTFRKGSSSDMIL